MCFQQVAAKVSISERRVSKRQSKKLSELDPESSEYWEKVLQDHKLGMGHGKSSKLSYVGGTPELGVVESSRYEQAVFGGRKVRVKGAKPE